MRGIIVIGPPCVRQDSSPRSGGRPGHCGVDQGETTGARGRAVVRRILSGISKQEKLLVSRGPRDGLGPWKGGSRLVGRQV